MTNESDVKLPYIVGFDLGSSGGDLSCLSILKGNMIVASFYGEEAEAVQSLLNEKDHLLELAAEALENIEASCQHFHIEENSDGSRFYTITGEDFDRTQQTLLTLQQHLGKE